MKVICQELPKRRLIMSPKTPVSVEVGREYTVISMLMSPVHPLQLQLLVGEPVTPAWFDAHLFSTTSSKIPSNWTIKMDASHMLSMGPAAWRLSGYWESYFNKDEWAIDLYSEQLALTLAES